MRRRSKIDAASSLIRQCALYAFLTAGLLYVVVVFLYELPFVSRPLLSSSPSAGGAVSFPLHLDSEEEPKENFAPLRPSKRPYRLPYGRLVVSGLDFGEANATVPVDLPFSALHRAARLAGEAGRKLFDELNTASLARAATPLAADGGRKEEKCPNSITMSGAEFRERGKVVLLPCGLTLGSHITVVAKPHRPHPERDPKITILREGEPEIMVSQFFMELQGLNSVDGEEPPRILHFNPRLKGDWSDQPVIELNTCYRMQWGLAQRCEGWNSREEEETVDGLVKCEKWLRDDDNRSEESKTTWWLNRLVVRRNQAPIDWPYPFMEEKLFILTLSAGLEGYHIVVDGRHVTSFPYRTGFALEDATGFFLNGDLDVKSIFAGSLPILHPSFDPQRHLDMSAEWKAQTIPDGPVELFIGILSAGNHFAERMAVRKSWMSTVRGSTDTVARFFVALNARKEVNLELKKEAEFFGDIVIVPYMDSYDLVVLKTVAICEYGVYAVSARYIMKCDDDTFVRTDSVINQVKKMSTDKILYLGNINYHHKPLREGKWAVTYEEWLEEDYPPYANGPGYVISSGIASFIVSNFEKRKLRLFKMEDVSMGLWVEQFNKSRAVGYVHDIRFCQFGCIEDYYTAHYQSPKQMICLWDKLQEGKSECCNMK